MAYAMMSSYGKADRSISAAASMLRGFNSTYPLTAIERKHLRLLIAARLSCSATLGAYSYQQNPENKYLLLHAEPAWKTLELVWGNNSSLSCAINCIFDRACDNFATIDKHHTINCTDIGFPDPAMYDDLNHLRSCKKHPRSDNSGPNEDSVKKAKQLNDPNNVITFVTGNKKKLEEVKRIMTVPTEGKELPFTISNQKIDLPELQGDTLEIAKEKCALAAKEIGGAVITEDTSLCFNALQNMPGPYIKWFLEKCGHDGLNNMIQFSDDKSGYAQTVVGFCAGPGQEVYVFDGKTQGKIVPARGPLNFGWDPIFEPEEGKGKTYAEMAKEDKDAISHRGRAFTAFRTFLFEKESLVKSEMQ
jgi:inosine triphosphate pyrophosphatase